MTKCIFLTGGGTAGHTTLNISLQDELKKYFDKIVYVGSFNGIEKELISKKTNYEYKAVTTVKLDRKNLAKDIMIPFLLSKGIKESKKLIEEYKPVIIFSKGGYVGLPVTIAGKKLGVPIVCHESDLSMGLANKLTKMYAKVVCTNFEKTAKLGGKKCICTGMPLILSKLSKNDTKMKLGINTEKPVLLVTGGSLGAKAINDFVFDNLDKLTERFFVYHITGKNNSRVINCDSYKQIEFSNDMKTVFKACDFALSRAGANTCFELLANKILTIFVPLPKGTSRGDQIENAKYFEDEKLCVSIPQENLTISQVMSAFDYLQKNANSIKNNIKNSKISDGTSKIIDVLLKNQLKNQKLKSKKESAKKVKK